MSKHNKYTLDAGDMDFFSTHASSDMGFATKQDVAVSAQANPANDTLADYLTDGYWSEDGRVRRSFDISAGGTVTVDIGDLTGDGKKLAKWALDAWTEASGIQFSFVNKHADIDFDDNKKGAYSQSWTDGDGNITRSTVNVAISWLNYSGKSIHSYSMQTYIHEIGHALGLGHAGNYNGSANYNDSYFANDSWQSSVMSYFSQDENWNVDAHYAYLLTPMVADILAIRELYGTTVIHGGDDTYSFKGDFQKFFAARTIVDTGGIDTLNFAWASKRQMIDLNAEAFSTIDGVKGNLGIARGTVIENASGGKSADKIFGNDAANVLEGNGGKDQLTGNAGADTFIFDTKAGAKNVDTIVDFTVGIDHIGIDNKVFTKVGADGSLGAQAFVATALGVAQDADDRLIYDTDSGKLFYDANGDKQGGAVLIAQLSAYLNLQASDFLVI